MPPLKADTATITCNGNVQNLADYLFDQPIKDLTAIKITGSADVYFDYASTVSSTSHIWKVKADTAPFMKEMTRCVLFPSQVYFRGTNGETFGVGVLAGRD